MTPLINLRGYTAPDPLDDLSPRTRHVLPMVIAGFVGYMFLYTVLLVFEVVEMEHLYYFGFALAAIVGLYVPIVIALRKSSTVLHVALSLAMFVPLELLVQHHMRDAGILAFWSYREAGFLGGWPPLAQFSFVWGITAFLVGPFTLYLSRILGGVLLGNKREPHYNTREYRALFADEITAEPVMKPTHDWAFYFMRTVGLVYAFYLGLVLLAGLGTSSYPDPLRGMLEMTYRNVPLAINTYVKLALVVMLSMIGAYNKELRFHTGIALLVAHLASTAISLVLLSQPGSTHLFYLMSSVIIDAVLAAGFIAVIADHKSSAKRYQINREFPEFYSLANRLTVGFFTAGGVLLLAAVAGVVAIRFLTNGETGWGAVFGYPDPQISNTITELCTLACVALMVARREALRSRLYPVLVGAAVVGAASSLTWLFVGGMLTDLSVTTRTGQLVNVNWYFMVNLAMNGFVLAAMLGLRRMYHNMEYSITALGPTSAANVMAVHDALHGTDAEMNGAVLQAVDRQAANIRGRKRGLLNFPYLLIEYAPQILEVRPPFSTMSREYRQYVFRHGVMRKPRERARAFSPEFANFLFMIGNAAHALITLAHYNHIRGHEEVGYIPPDARDRLQGDTNLGQAPFENVAPLPNGPMDPRNLRPADAPGAKLVAPRVVTAVREPAIPKEVDYMVVGSGAGGAVMAYRLACLEPNARIVVVERGPRYSPLQDFNDDEMEMVRKLYKEGGLQQTKRFDLMVLQGECVGGTTVINNSVCFKMPDGVKQEWENDYGLDLSRLESHYEQVAQDISIDTISPDTVNHRVAKRFLKGVETLRTSQTELGAPQELMANHQSMLGEGLCNIGNKRMRKRSMLETYLPWAEARGVEIIPETSAVRFYEDGNGRVTGVLLRTDLGGLSRVKVNKAVVVAGGVIASSHFLMRSEVPNANVGHHMACNFAFPMAFEFEEELKAYDGTQITLGTLDAHSRAVFETYFNPPGAFALSVPFYFDRLRDVMKRYPHMVNFGALVGSEANGVIEPKADVLNGRAFDWKIGERDRSNISYALSTLLKLGQAAGARRAIVPMEPGIEIDLINSHEVNAYLAALSNYHLLMSDLRLTTAHPQGGNAMAARGAKHEATRVVDENFRVTGYRNLYVADASLFPTGITVNPQWTIMALSSMAAEHVVRTEQPTGALAWPPASVSTLDWLLKRRKTPKLHADHPPIPPLR